MFLELAQAISPWASPFLDGVAKHWNGFEAPVEHVCVRLYSLGPHSCARMQGLLMALTGSFQTFLWDDCLSNMTSSLAQVTREDPIWMKAITTRGLKVIGIWQGIALHCMLYFILFLLQVLHRLDTLCLSHALSWMP